MTNIEKHKALCEELHSLYEKKNADYGDSFHKSFAEEGMAMPRIRLSDKLNRFKSITAKAEQKVSTESIRDTLIDLANYAIMTVMELDGDMVTDDNSLHKAALKVTGDNCGHGCLNCKAEKIRSANGTCLIRRIAKVENADEQIAWLAEAERKFESVWRTDSDD